MELNSILSNYSDNSTQYPITSDGAATKSKAEYLVKFPTIKPYKFENLSEQQKSSLESFSCGNSGIDTFLRHGEGLKFQVDRHKMKSMVMATETKVLGYMAYSENEVTFSIPKMCSKTLREASGLQKGDKIFVIRYLGIDLSCKKLGLGSALVIKAMTACMAKAKTDPNLKLIVLHATEAACGFYEKLGFRKIGVVAEGLIEYAYTVTE